MAPFPLDLLGLLGKPGTYLFFLIIGFGFGYALETSGFNKSTILAGQFYFRDSRVVKVFFTAIVVAMSLLFLAVRIGLLDYNLIWVPPTYLWPGIVGGLIMGVGFILGGFCPGTSIVAASTLKLDGVAYVLGGLVGAWAFGETERFFADFYFGSYYGRVTLMDLFHISTGAAMLLISLMAILFFFVMESLQTLVTGEKPTPSIPRRIAWFAPLIVSLIVFVWGDATPAEKWARIAPLKEPLLESRAVYIHPGELLDSLADDTLSVVMLDVRPETDYNLFHIHGAQRVDMADLPHIARELLLRPNINQTVIVLMSNDETAATQAWKVLQAESVPNVYILEGGVNRWIATFAAEEEGIQPASQSGEDQLAYTFQAALGDRWEASDPFPHDWELEYQPKIKLERKKGPSSGGCG
ncbi:MAG: sulfurtransferase [Anaerolineae bacterium]|nr:MAG: sulfurtransferase [Anaerolineae bacterium]